MLGGLQVPLDPEAQGRKALGVRRSSRGRWGRRACPHTAAVCRGSGNGTGQAAQGLIVVVAVIQFVSREPLSAPSGPSSEEVTQR